MSKGGGRTFYTPTRLALGSLMSVIASAAGSLRGAPSIERGRKHARRRATIADTLSAFGGAVSYGPPIPLRRHPLPLSAVWQPEQRTRYDQLQRARKLEKKRGRAACRGYRRS